MPLACTNIWAVLAGETFDLSAVSADPDNEYIAEIYVDGVSSTFAARTSGNSAGEQRDFSTNGVYAADVAVCKNPGASIVFGPFDKVYVGTGSVRVLIKNTRVRDTAIFWSQAS